MHKKHKQCRHRKGKGDRQGQGQQEPAPAAVPFDRDFFGAFEDISSPFRCGTLQPPTSSNSISYGNSSCRAGDCLGRQLFQVCVTIKSTAVEEEDVEAGTGGACNNESLLPPQPLPPPPPPLPRQSSPPQRWLHLRLGLSYAPLIECRSLLHVLQLLSYTTCCLSDHLYSAMPVPALPLSAAPTPGLDAAAPARGACSPAGAADKGSKTGTVFSAFSPSKHAAGDGGVLKPGSGVDRGSGIGRGNSIIALIRSAQSSHPRKVLYNDFFADYVAASLRSARPAAAVNPAAVNAAAVNAAGGPISERQIGSGQQQGWEPGRVEGSVASECGESSERKVRLATSISFGGSAPHQQQGQGQRQGQPMSQRSMSGISGDSDVGVLYPSVGVGVGATKAISEAETLYDIYLGTDPAICPVSGRGVPTGPHARSRGAGEGRAKEPGQRGGQVASLGDAPDQQQQQQRFAVSVAWRSASSGESGQSGESASALSDVPSSLNRANTLSSDMLMMSTGVEAADDSPDRAGSVHVAGMEAGDTLSSTTAAAAAESRSPGISPEVGPSKRSRRPDSRFTSSARNRETGRAKDKDRGRGRDKIRRRGGWPLPVYSTTELCAPITRQLGVCDFSLAALLGCVPPRLMLQALMLVIADRPVALLSTSPSLLTKMQLAIPRLIWPFRIDKTHVFHQVLNRDELERFVSRGVEEHPGAARRGLGSMSRDGLGLAGGGLGERDSLPSRKSSWRDAFGRIMSLNRSSSKTRLSLRSQSQQGQLGQGQGQGMSDGFSSNNSSAKDLRRVNSSATISNNVNANAYASDSDSQQQNQQQHPYAHPRRQQQGRRRRSSGPPGAQSEGAELAGDSMDSPRGSEGEGRGACSASERDGFALSPRMSAGSAAGGEGGGVGGGIADLSYSQSVGSTSYSPEHVLACNGALASSSGVGNSGGGGGEQCMGATGGAVRAAVLGMKNGRVHRDVAGCCTACRQTRTSEDSMSDCDADVDGEAEHTHAQKQQRQQQQRQQRRMRQERWQREAEEVALRRRCCILGVDSGAFFRARPGLRAELAQLRSGSSGSAFTFLDLDSGTIWVSYAKD